MIRIALSEKQVEELDKVFRETADRKLRDRLQIVLMTHRAGSASKWRRTWG